MGSALVTDGDDATAALVNQFMAAPASKTAVFHWYGRVHYDGASWVVDSATDFAGLTSGALSWNGTNNELEITLTDFSAAPLVQASEPAVDTAYKVQGHASTSVLAALRFYNRTTGALITTESTDMDAMVSITGTYT